MTEIGYPDLVGSALGGGEQRKEFRLTSAKTIYCTCVSLYGDDFYNIFLQIFLKKNKRTSNMVEQKRVFQKCCQKRGHFERSA